MDINKSDWGNMTVAGLAGTTNLQHIGRTGNINFGGAAASNYIYVAKSVLSPSSPS
jgi:hypothetical protein